MRALCFSTAGKIDPTTESGLTSESVNETFLDEELNRSVDNYSVDIIVYGDHKLALKQLKVRKRIFGLGVQ